jgi:hypothetical protein
VELVERQYYITKRARTTKLLVDLIQNLELKEVGLLSNMNGRG